MASKRFTKMTTDWTALAERVAEDQRPMLTAFKARSDGYLRRVLANPEQPPKIDWSYYSTRIPIKGLVEDFQKKYDALAIPYPKDDYTALVDEQEQDVMKKVAEFVKKSNANIANYEAEVKRLKSMLPVEIMTMQEFFNAYPDKAYDPNNPTFWPHDEAEQLGNEPPPKAHH